MILYIENPKDATRKLLELINEFSKSCRIKKNNSEEEWGHARGGGLGWSILHSI